MIKQGRNDPCHCGSGKKFKVCHGRAAKSFNQQWVIAGIIGGIFLLFFFMDSGTSTTTLNTSIPTSVIPRVNAGSAWHNIPTNPASAVPGVSPNLSQPQPPGETPPGKVWSPDHGHWHDIQ
jgi:hypothetical protein